MFRARIRDDCTLIDSGVNQRLGVTEIAQVQYCEVYQRILKKAKDNSINLENYTFARVRAQIYILMLLFVMKVFINVVPVPSSTTASRAFIPIYSPPESPCA